jgi:3-oxoacyl-[acyl-carrier-protein] synthase III
MSRYATIISTGRYLPENELSNAMLKERLGQLSPKLPEIVDKFEESSHIKTRWLAPRTASPPIWQPGLPRMPSAKQGSNQKTST